MGWVPCWHPLAAHPSPLVPKGSLSWAPSPGGEACSGLPGMASPPLPCPPCSPHTPHHNPVPAVPSPAPHPQIQRQRSMPSSSPADEVGTLTQAGPIWLSGTQRLRGAPSGWSCGLQLKPPFGAATPATQREEPRQRHQEMTANEIQRGRPEEGLPAGFPGPGGARPPAIVSCKVPFLSSPLSLNLIGGGPCSQQQNNPERCQGPSPFSQLKARPAPQAQVTRQFTKGEALGI